MAVKIRDFHALCLSKSTALSGYYVPNFIPPIDVVRVLNRAGVKFVLVGAHGIGGWTGKPRATEDVDVIVAARGHKKALAALQADYPTLVVQDLEVVTRLRDPDDNMVRIDVMKPNQPIIAAALKNTHTVKSGRETYQVPSLEMALALKFAPMTSLNRENEDKLQDAVDFMRVVRNNSGIDLTKLAALGDLVDPDGGKEIVELVHKVQAGEKLEI